MRNDVEGVDAVGDKGTCPLGPILDALGERDCFGKRFSKSATACERCLLPLVVDGHMTTSREECHKRSPGPKLAVNLSYREVAERLVLGKTADEIVDEMAGTDDDEVVRLARRKLGNRLSYMRNVKGWNVPGL